MAPLPVSAAALAVAVAVSEADASVSLAEADTIVVGAAEEVAEALVETALPALVALEVAFVKSGISTSIPYAKQMSAEPWAVTVEDDCQ